MNESAAQGAASPDATEVSDVLPVPESLDMPEALRSVARTGEARHLSYDLISSGLGAVAIVTSIYSLPDAMLLLVSETTFLASHRKPADELGERRSRRRT